MSETATEIATFAAGCFWGVESTFRRISGVTDVIVGYTAGTADNPTYQQVCSGRTGHAEAAQVTFDPSKVTYTQILDAFWQLHDPTTLDRQGADFGTQYRSGIYTHSEVQAMEAKAAREAAQSQFKKPIVTEIEEARKFWPAEDYHQRYFEKKGIEGGCHVKV